MRKIFVTLMFLLATLGFASATNAQFYGGPPPGGARVRIHEERTIIHNGGSRYDDYYRHDTRRRPMSPPQRNYNYRGGDGPCGTASAGECLIEGVALGFALKVGSNIADEFTGGRRNSRSARHQGGYAGGGQYRGTDSFCGDKIPVRDENDRIYACRTPTYGGEYLGSEKFCKPGDDLVEKGGRMVCKRNN